MMKSLVQSIVQDLVTALAAILSAHGFLTPGDQQQGFIGAVFFLVMLAVNSFLQHSQTKDKTP